MEKRVDLRKYGKQLWTREKARPIAQTVEDMLDELEPGDIVVLDTDGVEVFDFSFANELFGRPLLALPNRYQGRFLVVENLNEYTRENLSKALESLGIPMIERKGKKLRLLGKCHPVDEETFGTIAHFKGPVTSNQLSNKLGLQINAINERLTKLVNLGLVRRDRTASSSGREQFQYTILM